MARFTKTFLDEDKRFIGWDELDTDSVSTEATRPEDLGFRMVAADTTIFEGLSPGSVFTSFDRVEYFREW